MKQKSWNVYNIFVMWSHGDSVMQNFFANYKTHDKNFGEIPYTAHGEQITPPPLFLIFVFMLILG